ncbi:hypothetical protein [Desulfogranum japonicum]|uniref:hypothetical protein n=1 Tax=Desulfogranum japonicum TaxID=231447 RepID=UPI00048E0D9A|nr:hypothetical protein [Desulfogranum japonicum]
MITKEDVNLPSSLITVLVHYSLEPETAESIVRFYCLRMLDAFYAYTGNHDSSISVTNPYDDESADCRVLLKDLEDTLTLYRKIGVLQVDLDEADEATLGEINNYKRQMIKELADLIR